MMETNAETKETGDDVNAALIPPGTLGCYLTLKPISMANHELLSLSFCYIGK
jgi:hypothetical protein